MKAALTIKIILVDFNKRLKLKYFKLFFGFRIKIDLKTVRFSLIIFLSSLLLFFPTFSFQKTFDTIIIQTGIIVSPLLYLRNKRCNIYKFFFLSVICFRALSSFHYQNSKIKSKPLFQKMPNVLYCCCQSFKLNY